jgi:adenine-specific DNA-methyltransferase
MDKVAPSLSYRTLGHVPTPAEIVQRMVTRAAPLAHPSTVLEPACGDARFLKCFGETFGFHHKLIGVEINPCHPLPSLHDSFSTPSFRFPLLAGGTPPFGSPRLRGEPVGGGASSSSRLARTKKCRAISDVGKSGGGVFQVIQADFLLWEPRERFDIVIGNPPYGIVGDESHYPLHVLRERKAEYKRRSRTWRGKYNLYGAFMEKGVRLLKPGGRLVFIVPTTWLVLDDFVLLRRLLAQSGGLEVFYVGRVFPKVNVSCVILRFTSGGAGLRLYDWAGCLGEPKLVVHKPRYEGELIRFETEEWLAFEQSGIPLGELFRIHFAARSPEFRKSGLVIGEPRAGYVPVLTGRNLKPGWIDYERCYSGWWMRREDGVRLRAFYGEPHLVVGHTKGARLVCAVDWRCFPWREEYHLIPRAGVQVDLKAVECYLNSERVQAYLQSLYRDLTPHLTKTMLARVPLLQEGVGLAFGADGGDGTVSG